MGKKFEIIYEQAVKDYQNDCDKCRVILARVTMPWPFERVYLLHSYSAQEDGIDMGREIPWHELLPSQDFRYDWQAIRYAIRRFDELYEGLLGEVLDDEIVEEDIIGRSFYIEDEYFEGFGEVLEVRNDDRVVIKSVDTGRVYVVDKESVKKAMDEVPF